MNAAAQGIAATIEGRAMPSSYSQRLPYWGGLDSSELADVDRRLRETDRLEPHDLEIEPGTQHTPRAYLADGEIPILVKEGNDAEKLRRCRNEELASEIARACGMPYGVPLTILRGHPDIAGGAPSSWQFGFAPDKRTKAGDLGEVAKAEIAALGALDFLIANTDRNGANWLTVLDENGDRHCVLTDNGNALQDHAVDPGAFGSWIVKAALAQEGGINWHAIASFCDPAVHARMQPMMEPQLYQALCDRVAHAERELRGSAA
jgi:hypothetical protein